MDRPFLKAGLLGGLALVLVNALGLVPTLACLTLPLGLIGYVVIGALAAHWLPPQREPSTAAGQGALAGLVAAVISGISQVILTPVMFALSGGSAAVVRQLSANTLQLLQEAGIDPGVLLGGGTLAAFSLLCCLPIGLLAGAALGALGGLIRTAVRPE